MATAKANGKKVIRRRREKKNIEDNAFRPAPKWIEYDKNNMTAKIVAVPARDDIDMPIEEHLIVELYSK